MLRKFFMAAAVALAAAIPAMAQTSDATLESIVESANAECPMDIDNNSSIDAVKLTDKAVEIHLVMPVPPAQFAMVEQSMNMLRPTLLQMFSTDPNTREIFAPPARTTGRNLSPSSTRPQSWPMR